MTRYEKRRARVARLAAFEAPEANAKRVAKNTLVLYLRMFAVMAVGLYTGRVMLQALGVDDYGLQGVAGAVVGMFTFLNGSLAAASSRFLTVEMGKGTIGSLKRTFSTILTVHFILACIFVVILETVGLTVLETKLNIDPSRIAAVKWVYHCSVISCFFGITQVPYSAAIVAHERMSAFAWMAIYDVVVKLAIAGSLMVYQGDRLAFNGSLWLANGLMMMMIYRGYCIRSFSETRYRRVFDSKILGPIFVFAGWQVAAQTAQMLCGQAVVMLNQRYFGPALITAITIAQTVGLQIESFVNNFRVASNPQIVKLYSAEKYAESKELLKQTTHISSYMLLALGVPIWFYSNEALYIWLGSNVPRYSPLMVKFVLAGAFLSLFDSSLYQILYATGRLKENAFFNICNGVGVFVLTWTFILWTHNPLVSIVFWALKYMTLGLIFKPYILHKVAGYTIKDFMEIYVPSFKALVTCVAIGYLIRLVAPSSLIWAVPSCAVIAFLCVLTIFVFIADNDIQLLFIKGVNKVPVVGVSIATAMSRLSRIRLTV